MAFHSGRVDNARAMRWASPGASACGTPADLRGVQRLLTAIYDLLPRKGLQRRARRPPLARPATTAGKPRRRRGWQGDERQLRCSAHKVRQYGWGHVAGGGGPLLCQKGRVSCAQGERGVDGWGRGERARPTAGTPAAATPHRPLRVAQAEG